MNNDPLSSLSGTPSYAVNIIISFEDFLSSSFYILLRRHSHRDGASSDVLNLGDVDH
jgi:hypothetical protein